MSCWLCIPSARPPEEAEKCLAKWRQQGYKIALWRDGEPDEVHDRDASVEILRTSDVYPGYARAVNFLVHRAMERDPQAEWFVIGGDDVEPDMNHTAKEIAWQCSTHFYEHVELEYPGRRPAWAEIPIPSPGGSGKNAPSWIRWSTFGVMQPTGDRFAEGSIDRICGSAWLGREFCRRINQGKGPLWPEYVHNFVDEELQAVAIKYGIFQQRRDLVHLHHHFMRENDRLNSPAVKRETPAHLKAAFSPEEGWGPYKAIFDRRKREGFPGSEPIA